jgi:hypothetical protein
MGFLLVNVAIDSSGDAAAAAAYYRVCSASALATKMVPVLVILMATASAHTMHHTGSLASKINVVQLALLALPFYVLYLLPLMASSGGGDVATAGGGARGMRGGNLLMLSFVALNVVCMAIDSDEGHTSKKASKLLKIWQMWRVWKS